MKLYHLNVLVIFLLLGFFYFENNFVMSTIGSWLGISIRISQDNLIYLTGVFTVFIIGYLIKKHEA